MTVTTVKLPIMGDDSIMRKKQHGTSETPVQKNLRWGCDWDTADRVCNFNRNYAEHASYFLETIFPTDALKELEDSETKQITFYDSNSGKPLFHVPVNRSWEDFIEESMEHGWPSFRDEETVWENVRCLKSTEAVSIDGTHLGHNVPDRKGNRYCVNLVSVAGHPLT